MHVCINVGWKWSFIEGKRFQPLPRFILFIILHIATITVCEIEVDYSFYLEIYLNYLVHFFIWAKLQQILFVQVDLPRCSPETRSPHYNDVIMTMIASQITSLAVVYSSVYSGTDFKKKSKLPVTGLCAGNLPGTGDFPAQMACNAENVSIWLRHHDISWRLDMWLSQRRPIWTWGQRSFTSHHWRW